MFAPAVLLVMLTALFFYSWMMWPKQSCSPHQPGMAELTAVKGFKSSSIILSSIKSSKP
jgi:hypothetical protein